MRARTKMLTRFESHRFNLVIKLLFFFLPLDQSLPKNKVKYLTVKFKHFSAVLVYFAIVYIEISVQKYKEFKEVNFYSIRARTKVLASFESQRIELAFICILIAQ